MKTILLPTDFSKNSMNAIDYAIRLFKDIECHFYILNVQKASSFITDDMMVMSSSATIYNTIIDAAKKSIANIISKIESENNNDKHHFHAVVDYDNFIDSINQVSSKYKVDLIVMGTKGATGLDKVIFGSNTVRVIQRCDVPVLIIPDGCKYKKMHHIAFSSNHFTLFEKQNIEVLRSLMHFNESDLTILHVADEHHLAQQQEQNMDFFNTYFPEATHEYIDVNSKEMVDYIKNYLEDNNINLLAMISEKHSFLERLFIRYPVETFAFHKLPFLVMHSLESSH